MGRTTGRYGPASPAQEAPTIHMLAVRSRSLAPAIAVQLALRRHRQGPHRSERRSRSAARRAAVTPRLSIKFGTNPLLGRGKFCSRTRRRRHTIGTPRALALVFTTFRFGRAPKETR